jgi:hypothetical protein
MALLFVEMCAFYFMGTAIHEEFHMLAGNVLGVDGYVVFNLDVAHYYWQGQVDTVAATIIRLAGGLGSGLLFYVLYLIFDLRNRETGHYQMEMFTFLAISIWQIVYGLSETISELGITTGNLIGLGCGFWFAFVYLTFLKKKDIYA